MNPQLTVSIGRLSLDSPMSGRERAGLADAISTELTRRLGYDAPESAADRPNPIATRVAAAIDDAVRQTHGFDVGKGAS